MGDHQWPNTGRHPPKAVADHSASLKADFDNVNNTVKANLSRVSELPSNLRDKIANSISNGIAEVQSNKHWSKRLSEVDKESFTKAILDNITIETAASARNTIPLPQFYGLHKSYQELHAKLDTQLPPTKADSRVDGVGGEATANFAVVNGTQIIEKKSYSATIILNIVHQTSVNRMEGKNSRYLGEAISVSLEASFSDCWFRGSVRLSAASLLDCGNVEVVAHAEHRGDLERLIQTTAWHEEYERSLGPLPIQTYNVRMHNMRIGCMRIMNRKEKSIVIKTLADTNFPVDSDNSIIKDISWCGKMRGKKGEQGTTALMIEFLFPEQANKALTKGLSWQGTRHACNIADQRQFGLQRCLNCQNYGHCSQICSAEPQCGTCAGQHIMEKCTSTKIECVLCGGPHPSARENCPAREQAKKFHRFPTTHLSPAGEPVAEVQDAIKREHDSPEAIFDPTRDIHSIPGTRLPQTDNSRAIRVGRDTGLQSHAPVRQKREAEDTLPEAESGGDVKRIKQEDLKQEEPWHRENPMPLYREPSPYIINRPD